MDQCQKSKAIQKFQGLLILLLVISAFASGTTAHAKGAVSFPKLRVKETLTYAPQVPAPITRRQPAVVEVHMTSMRQVMEVKKGLNYEFWTFDGHVPGPFIRVRVGDILEVHHESKDTTGMPHNIDFHAVTGPGGGAPVTTVVPGDKRVSWFKMMAPGLYIYHCAAPPVMDHIANGMYGLILVEPANGLPKVDKEFYVMQSEIYAQNPDGEPKPVEVDHAHMGGKEDKSVWGDEVAQGKQGDTVLLKFSHQKGLEEHPMFVVFNGRVGSLTNEGVLKAKVGDRVRIFFGNGGPNLISSFHVIGEIFNNVYREGDLVSPPAHNVQTTLVPAGGATVVEFALEVPGNYTLVDHAIFRVEKGAAGFLQASGDPNYNIYLSDQDPVKCPGCLVHP